jgi:hypothetical protein
MLQDIAEIMEFILNDTDDLIQRVLHGAVDDMDESPLTDKEKFRLSITEMYITSRRIAFDAMREGLTLDAPPEDGFPFSLLQVISRGAMDKVLIAKQRIDMDAILSVIEPEYEESTGDLREMQERVFRRVGESREPQGVLVDVLRSLNEKEGKDFPRLLLFFGTGYKFLPQSDGFKITLEFNCNAIEFMASDALPMADTCNCTIRLPGRAYEGNAEELEKKLLWSLKETDHSGGGFA